MYEPSTGRGFFRNAHRFHSGEIRLLPQLFQQTGKRFRMMKDGITLPKPELARLYRKKLFLIINNLPAQVSNTAREVA